MSSMNVSTLWKNGLQQLESGVSVTTMGAGTGYKSSAEVFSSPQLDATHVTWYNK